MDAEITNANFGAQITGADVYLDGVIVGTTDANGQISLMGMTYGNHTIKVVKYGYYDTEQSFSIPETTTLNLILVPITVDVTVTVSD